MTLPVATQSYTQATGSASNAVFITVFLTRPPTVNDIQYPVAKRWVNTSTAKEYILTGFTTTGGVTQAIWINLTNGVVGALEELSGNAGTNPVLPDGDGNINVIGDSTSISISGNGVHTLTANVILPSQADVVLLGETTSIGHVANGTEGQVLTSHTSGPPTFQSAASGLTLGAFGNTPNANAAAISSGVLTLEPASALFPGGLKLGAQVLGTGIKTFTDAPIIPLTGILVGNLSSQVSATTVTNNAAIIGGTANALVSIPLNNGQFVIGSTGSTPAAGTIVAGTGISVTPGVNTITVASTATGFVWIRESGNFSALAGHGYSVTANATATLPATPSLGDTISFYVLGSVTLIIQAPGSDRTVIGPTPSSAGGTCTNTASGDSITFVCIDPGPPNGWGTINAPQGVWLLS